MSDKFIFDPSSAEFIADPYSSYAQMRALHPIYFHRDWNMLMLSRYEDITALVNDKRLVRTLDHLRTADEVAAIREKENWHTMPNLSSYVRKSILDSEGEYHDRLRKLVFKVFTPGLVATLRDEVHEIVKTRSQVLQGRQEIDFIEDFVATIPGFVIGMLLGVPESDRPRLRRWSEQIVQFFEPGKTLEDIKIAELRATEFSDYLKHLIQKRRQQPEKDLISELVAEQAKGSLDEEELISICMLILMAGHGSTIDVSGNGMLALLRNREQWEKLRSDKSLMPSAVQEILRYDSPLPFFHRFTAEELTYKDNFIPKGAKIGVLYGSANRDETQVPDPDTFNIERNPNRHLAFGIGAHFCLGNHLARLNIDSMFSQIAAHFPDIELANDVPEFRPGVASRGLKSLPVLLGRYNN